MGIEKQWNNIKEKQKEKIPLQPRILSPVKISLKIEYKMKMFSDKQKLR